MPQPYIDEMGVTHYNDATGSGTVADPYIPKVAVTGLVLSESSYDKLINLLQKTQLDPDYQSQVLMSEAELARFDLVLVNEIEDLI
jgi:hypothetical protein